MPRISTHAWLAAGALLACAPLHAQAGAPAPVPTPARVLAGQPLAPAAARPAARDSAQVALRQRFAADVLALASAAGAPAGLVVLATDAGGRTELKLARASVTEAALAPAVDRVREELKAFAAEGPLVWHVRLDPVALAPGGRTTAPVIANPREVRAQINRFVVQHFTTIFQGRRGLRVDLQLVVTRDGEVAFARVVRSSGHAVVDQGALQIAPGMRFNPARVGTQPVDTRITFPLYFVVGEA
ncbi:MAG TPA: energy transducer TonB [Longimicrobium sp.]|nr:energy transducer TonB [Longimicrobium sp.]